MNGYIGVGVWLGGLVDGRMNGCVGGWDVCLCG